MNIIAIIPARGGSKGIPRKNLYPLAGYPLLAYTIDSAKKSDMISQVLVTTDDEEIAQVSKSYGAEVIIRPPEISGDEASSESALLHVLNTIQSLGDSLPDIIVFLQCTSPLTKPEDIDAAIDKLISSNADSCFSATPSHSFLWHINPEGLAEGINHDPRYRPRRQEMQPQYRENGAIYVMRTEGFMKASHRFFGKTVISVMPPERSWDIDEPMDLIIAEQLLMNVLPAPKYAILPYPLEAIIFDFDGVFTNNTVYTCEDGTEIVRCHRGDGYGIEQIRNQNIPLLVISRETNPVVSERCKKLGIECLSGIQEKEILLRDWLKHRMIDPKQVIYVGNDENDLTCMNYVGCPVAVADAVKEVRDIAHIVLSKKGGEGAVRELVDMIINSKKGKILWE